MESSEEVKGEYLTTNIIWPKIGKTAARYKKEADKLQKVLGNLSVAEESTKNIEEYISLEEQRQKQNFSLTEIQKGTIYSLTLERFINAKSIINSIKDWLKNLKWSDDSCLQKAKLFYLSEASNQIFCEFHANPTEHSTNPHSLESELSVSKAALYSIEKLLVTVQEQLCLVKSENTAKDLNLYKRNENELDSKFNELKINLKNMKERIKHIVKNVKTKNRTNKMQKIKYESLSFIQDDWKKCKELILTILSAISDILRDK